MTTLLFGMKGEQVVGMTILNVGLRARRLYGCLIAPRVQG